MSQTCKFNNNKQKENKNKQKNKMNEIYDRLYVMNNK